MRWPPQFLFCSIRDQPEAEPLHLTGSRMEGGDVGEDYDATLSVMFTVNGGVPSCPPVMAGYLARLPLHDMPSQSASALIHLMGRYLGQMNRYPSR
jgi:hypothetical protein